MEEENDGGGLTLWDAAHGRRHQDHKPLTGAAKARNPHVPSTHADGDYFEQPVPQSRVIGLGEYLGWCYYSTVDWILSHAPVAHCRS